MQTSSLFRQFIRYTSLNILSALGISCYVLADTVFIANGIGNAGLTALNLAIPFFNLINGLGLMLGIGCSSAWCILRTDSSSDQNRLNGLFTACFGIALVLGLLFTGTGLLFSKQLAALMGASGEILGMTAVYLKILFCFAPLFLIQNILICFARAVGSPAAAMSATLFGCLFNIIFDYIFIFPMNLGMKGAILATGASPSLGILICTGYLLTKGKILRFSAVRTGLCMLPSALRDSLRFGSAAFITELSTGIVMAVYNFMILSIAGDIGVAAYGIIANLAIIVMAVFTGITQGMQPLTASAFGRKETDSLKKLLYWGILLSLLISLIITLSALFTKEELIGIFNKEEDPILFSLTAAGIPIYFAGFFPAGINMVLAAHAACCGRTIPAVVIPLLRGLFIITAAAILLGSLFGMTGIFSSFAVTEVITLAAGYVLFRKTAKSGRTA